MLSINQINCPLIMAAIIIISIIIIWELQLYSKNKLNEGSDRVETGLYIFDIILGLRLLYSAQPWSLWWCIGNFIFISSCIVHIFVVEARLKENEEKE